MDHPHSVSDAAQRAYCEPVTTALDAASREPAARRWQRWEGEAAGAFADLGVLVPIAIALIVQNGLSPTAVLLPAGLTYLMVARVYRVPVAVQPLKAFGAVAIAAGASSDVIAAGALLMGAAFLVLGIGTVLNRVAAWFPVPVIRGVQLAVGLTFLKIAWGLVASPPASFTHQLPPLWVGVLAAGAAALLLVWRRLIIPVAFIGFVVAIVLGAGGSGPGASPVEVPTLDLAAFSTAAVLLVVPQLPLSLANSCLAPADAARTYFGVEARRVTPHRLARTMGLANLFAGSISGMPVCHGAGGMSAHHAFGARTWRAPLLIGTLLVVVALVFGEAFVGVVSSFPLPVLAALLVVAAVAHIALLKDLNGRFAWSLALAVGIVGVATNLAWAVVGGLVVNSVAGAMRRRRSVQTSGDRHD
jgi:MFS superfamily sulfate permease-like transporter